MRDLVYAGSPRNVYRLSIGADPHLDFVFPPAGLAGTEGRYRLFGRNLPGGQAAGGLAIDGKPLEMLDVSIRFPPLRRAGKYRPARSSSQSRRKSTEWSFSSLRLPGLRIRCSSAWRRRPIVAELEPNDDPAHAQALSLPCEVVGQFYPRGDRDWVSFEAHKGDSYWIEVFAQRLGMPADAVLTIQQVVKNETGAEVVTDLATIDDNGANPAGDLFFLASDDPVYPFTAPVDGTYRVMVTDLAGTTGGRDLAGTTRSDPRFVYSLVDSSADGRFPAGGGSSLAAEQCGDCQSLANRLESDAQARWKRLDRNRCAAA